MAESLPSPPTSREATPQEDLDSSSTAKNARKLDDLLEQYLETLDEYTVLREELSKAFSGGFLSLAHAQRSSNLGPGRRYGPDGYDGRMKATKRVNIAKNDRIEQSTSLHAQGTTQSKAAANMQCTFDVVAHVRKPSPDAKGVSGTNIKKSHSGEDEKVSKDPHTTTGEIATAMENGQSKSAKVDPAYRDPITWYGILVPSQLRQAQRSFIHSVDDIIPKLLTSSKGLENLETQIWSLRRELGLLKQGAGLNTTEASLAIRTTST